MWEAFMPGIGWETKIYPSLAEAQDWVRIRVKEKSIWIFLSLRLEDKPADLKLFGPRTRWRVPPRVKLAVASRWVNWSMFFA
jgi:hypothetical protein